MRFIFSMAAAALIAAPLALGQTAPTDTTVLVLPLTVSSDVQNQWLGRAAQQDLLADLTQSTVSRVLAPANAPPAADQAAALKDARDAHANFVVYGQIQMNAKDIRMTGQVLDVASGKPLGAMKATGPSDQLFHLEDALEAQVFSNLPPTLRRAPAQPIAAPQQPAAPPVVISQPPVVDVEPSYQPQDNYVYPTQVYGDYPSLDDGYSGYSYPYDYGYDGAYLGGPIIINGYGGYHHPWNDRRGIGRQWNGGSAGRSVGRAPIVSRGESHFAPTREESHFSGGFRGSAGGGFHGSAGGGFHGAAGGGFHGGGHR